MLANSGRHKEAYTTLIESITERNGLSIKTEDLYVLGIIADDLGFSEYAQTLWARGLNIAEEKNSPFSTAKIIELTPLSGSFVWIDLMRGKLMKAR